MTLPCNDKLSCIAERLTQFQTPLGSRHQAVGQDGRRRGEAATPRSRRTEEARTPSTPLSEKQLNNKPPTRYKFDIALTHLACVSLIAGITSDRFDQRHSRDESLCTSNDSLTVAYSLTVSGMSVCFFVYPELDRKNWRFAGAELRMGRTCPLSRARAGHFASLVFGVEPGGRYTWMRRLSRCF